MALTATKVAMSTVHGIGTLITYKCVLSGTVTAGTIDDTDFSIVYKLNIVGSAADVQGDTVKDVYFDGTNIKVAGCDTDGTVYVTAIGR